MKESMSYESMTENRVCCNLCHHQCKIHEGKRGICGVRENWGGKLYSLVYGKIIAEHIDPIEKKPLFKLMKALGVWVEVTTLIIPGLNDGEEELRHIAHFVKGIGPEVPWHVTRFYPAYKYLDRPPTPVATLRQAREIGLEEGLRYVYEGNLPGEGGENTYCYACGAILIERYGMRLLENRLEDGKCPDCGAKLDGVGL